MESYTTAVGIDTRLYMAYTSIGKIEYDRGDYSKALIEFDKALKINGKSTITLQYAGLASEKQGLDEQAIEYYARFL